MAEPAISARPALRPVAGRSGFAEFWARFSRHRAALAGSAVVLVLLAVAALAPWVAPYSDREQNLTRRFEGPSLEHPFGLDELGRDILSRVIYGSRISLAMGVVAVGIALVGGVILGLLAGYFRQLDGPISRTMDILLAFPGILLAIAVVAALGPNERNAMIAVGIESIPAYVRLTRASVLSLKEREFIEAARALGAGNGRILLYHILPNVIAPIIVFASLNLSTAILTASTLSFLGLGPQPPTSEWGAMVSSSRGYLRVAPHLMLFPTLAIFITVLAFNFVGDGLRDALDPRLRGT
jgi:ABC-type dipeptide/oligopeptide/nickel transport system permease subunit